jgi:hypothetical protein
MGSFQGVPHYGCLLTIEAEKHMKVNDPLYDGPTLWNAVARAGEIERARLTDETADALRFRWLCEHPDWHFIERLCREFAADSSMEFLAGLRRVIDARRAGELGPFEEHLSPGPNGPVEPDTTARGER